MSIRPYTIYSTVLPLLHSSCYYGLLTTQAHCKVCMRYGPGIQHFPPHEVPPEPNYLPPATCHASPRHSIASIHSHSVPSHPLSFHLKIRLPASCGSPIVIASSCQTRSVASRSSLRTTYRWSRILFSGEHSSTLGSLGLGTTTLPLLA